MSEQPKITVTLHWRQDGAETQQCQIAFVDQMPQQLIPRLVETLRLPLADRDGNPITYQLRLGGEQRPALRPRELLSNQSVRFGSGLWLVSQMTSFDQQQQRCILRLPDGTEIIIAARGQELTRTWLLKFIELHNPHEYELERERFMQGVSAYSYVADSEPHCSLRFSDRGYWIVTTDRTDRLTEWSAKQEFEPIPAGAPIRLDDGMRLRLGGPEGLEITVILT